MGRDLSITVNGIQFPNPFMLGSGPPTTNGRVMAKAFEAGWGGAVAKTISLECAKVKNVSPRYGKLKARASGEVVGFENIELISDRPIEKWIEDFKMLKKEYPKNVLIASIMEEPRKEAWQEITRMVQDCGVDGIELNLSCPHGMPERGMGQVMCQVPAKTEEVTRWVTEVAKVPVWAKMTPNITDISPPALAAVKGGAKGISAINTILSIIGVDLETLRPMPTVEGHTIPGGYSCQAVRPIALRQVMELGRSLPKDVSICGIGGIETATDAIQFFLLGAHTVQICTGVMLYGQGIIEELRTGLERFLQNKDFPNLAAVIGKSLPYFTTHAALVEKQKSAKRAKAGESGRDEDWGKEAIEKTTASHMAN